MTDILEEFHSYDLETRLPGAPIDLNVNDTRIHYTLPDKLNATFLDADWFCPLLFTMFSLKDLIRLISAVLLEKTIVFVGDVE